MNEDQIKLLRDTWARAEALGDDVPLRFYSILLQDPVVRRMFPPGMMHQRDKLVHAIGLAITNVDNLDSIRPALRKLGVDHRRFGATQIYYGVVLDALLATFEHFFGEEWNEDLTDAWTMAYEAIAQVMIDAAHEQAETGVPPWWDAPIARVNRPNSHHVQLLLDTSEAPEGYQVAPGDDLEVMHIDRPGLWTTASVMAPWTPDFGLEIKWTGLDFAAMALARLKAGDHVRLGAPWIDPEEETK